MHEVGSRFLDDRRERGANLEERDLQATKKKMLGIIDEMRGMFKEWRRKNAARRATELMVVDRSLPVLYPPTPTARSSLQGINTEPISPPTFDSTTNWDVVDDGWRGG